MVSISETGSRRADCSSVTGENLLENFVDWSISELLDCGRRLEADKVVEDTPKPPPAVGVYSSATAEGIVTRRSFGNGNFLCASDIVRLRCLLIVGFEAGDAGKKGRREERKGGRGEAVKVVPNFFSLAGGCQ